jgi:hypothetical protein
VGALDFYRDQAGLLSDYQLRASLMAAEVAALALLRLGAHPDDAFADGAFVDDGADRSLYQLQVHQATGMVQVQLGITTEAALLVLRARSFTLGRPVVDVARDVVGRKLRFSVEDQ